MDDETENYKKLLDLRSEMSYLSGVLDGINRVLDDVDDLSYINYVWYDVSGKLDHAVAEARKLGMTVEDYNG